MLTIRSSRLAALGLAPGALVLDAGAGFGRHAFELARQERASSPSTTRPTRSSARRTRSRRWSTPARSRPTATSACSAATPPGCRSPSRSFDAVITSEVLEHIPDDTGALAELARVLKPGGVFAATVPTWLPEKINWMLSDEYHAPAAVGGHVRIYSATELKAKLRAAGLQLAGSHHAHALHSPYWWLKCAVGVNDDDHPLVRRYRTFLEWDIVEQPRSTRVAERVLSPVLGKSLVLYATKPAGIERRAIEPASSSTSSRHAIARSDASPAWMHHAPVPTSRACSAPTRCARLGRAPRVAAGRRAG